MRNIWLVAKHDIKTTLSQPTFWFLALVMPVLLVGFNAFTILRESGSTSAPADSEEQASQADAPVIGLVDMAGLTAELPAGFPPDLFEAFDSEAVARAALEAGEIDQYATVPSDYVATGEITVYDKNYQIMRGENDVGLASATEWMLTHIINYNLTGDEPLVTALNNPVPGSLVRWHALSPPPETDRSDQDLADLMSTVLPLIFYFLLLMSSNYLLRAVVAEKENRTVEVLLVSLDAREMMIGKILASSAVLVIQLAIWLGGGWIALDRGASLLNLTAFDFGPGFLVWGLLFLLLGYLVFASVMAAGGALAQNVREGAALVWLLVIPMMPTMMFGELIASEPNHPLTLVLSLFPLSAPSAMVTRLAAGTVPLWQIVVSLLGLALTAYLFIMLAARFFRAGNLLSEASFDLRRLAKGWRK